VWLITTVPRPAETQIAPFPLRRIPAFIEFSVKLVFQNFSVCCIGNPLGTGNDQHDGPSLASPVPLAAGVHPALAATDTPRTLAWRSCHNPPTTLSALPPTHVVSSSFEASPHPYVPSPVSHLCSSFPCSDLALHNHWPPGCFSWERAPSLNGIMMALL
jgi:hypothetical protein